MRPRLQRRLAGPALLLALLSSGCGTLEPSLVDRLIQDRQRCLLPLVDADGAPRGLGVVVRASYGEVLLAGAGEGGPAVWVQVGRERVPTRALARGLVSIPRRWDLRAALPAGPLETGREVLVLTGRRGAWIDGWASQVQSAPGEPLRLAPATPPAERDDRSGPDPSPDDLRGGVVCTLTGELVGLVREVEPDQHLRVRELGELVADVLAEMAPGEEVLAPDEAARVLQLSLETVEGLPAATDSWGSPDFLLLLQVAGTQLAPIQLSGPARRERGPRLVRVPDLSPVEARLVERDVTLAEGVVDHEVGIPLARPALAERVTLAFEPHPEFLRAQPSAWLTGQRVRVDLSAVEVDPDRTSGPDRTPLGATSVVLRRIAGGTVDLVNGDATDLLVLDVPGPGELACVFLRRDPRASISLQARAEPGLDMVFQLQPGSDRRLSIAHGPFPAGRALLRVRMLAGPPSPSTWELLFAPASDPFGLMRALFRLLSREAESEAAWLDTREFAEELAAALAFEAGMDPDTAASAILAELGHRNAVVRHLVLRLLELHFPASDAALESVRAEGLTTPRGLDAGLLLALRRGGSPRDVEVLRRASVDPDPLIRLRALVVVSRLDDPVLRAAMRELFRNDPSPLVRRALERSD